MAVNMKDVIEKLTSQTHRGIREWHTVTAETPIEELINSVGEVKQPAFYYTTSVNGGSFTLVPISSCQGYVLFGCKPSSSRLVQLNVVEEHQAELASLASAIRNKYDNIDTFLINYLEGYNG